MTTDFNFSRSLGLTRKTSFGNIKSVLFSPITVLSLVTLLFAFFLTASRGNSYLYQNNAQEREIIKTEFANEHDNKSSALRYERIVTGADPIRSILQ